MWGKYYDVKVVGLKSFIWLKDQMIDSEMKIDQMFFSKLIVCVWHGLEKTMLGFS